MATTPPLVLRDMTKEPAVPATLGYVIIGIVDGALVNIDPGTILNGLVLDYNSLDNIPELGDLAVVNLPTSRDATLFLAGDGSFRTPPAGTVVIENPGGGGTPTPVSLRWADLNGEPGDNSALATLLALLAPKANPSFTGTPKTVTPDVNNAAGKEITNAEFVIARLAKLINDAGASTDTAFSSTHTIDVINAAFNAFANSIRGGSGELKYSTFTAIDAALKGLDNSGLTQLQEAMKSTVRFDVQQNLTPANKAQLYANLGLTGRLLPDPSTATEGQTVVFTGGAWIAGASGSGSGGNNDALQEVIDASAVQTASSVQSFLELRTQRLKETNGI